MTDSTRPNADDTNATVAADKTNLPVVDDNKKLEDARTQASETASLETWADRIGHFIQHPITDGGTAILISDKVCFTAVCKNL